MTLAGKKLVPVSVDKKFMRNFIDTLSNKFSSALENSMSSINQTLSDKLGEMTQKLDQPNYEYEYADDAAGSSVDQYQQFSGGYDFENDSQNDSLLDKNEDDLGDEPAQKRKRSEHDISSLFSGPSQVIQPAQENQNDNWSVTAGTQDAIIGDVSGTSSKPKSILPNLGFHDEIKSDQSGPPVKQELADLVSHMIKEGIIDDTLADKIKKYPRPQNCEALSKVTVNKLIWEKMTPSARSQDVKLQKVQTNLIAGVSAVVKSVDKLLDLPDINDEIIRGLFDGISLFAMANREVNLRRREHIRPELNQSYRHLCSSSLTVTSELFGDDVSKQVKDLTEVNRVGRRISGRPQAQRNHYNSNFGTHFGNDRSRGHYNRPYGRGHSGQYRGRGNFSGKRHFLCNKSNKRKRRDDQHKQ